MCSRQQDYLANGKNLFWQVAIRDDIVGKVRKIPGNVAIQGELCGWTIQGNSMGFKEDEHVFVVFAVWDIDRQTYWPVTKVVDMCKDLGITHAPVIGYYVLKNFATDLKHLVDKAEGMGMNGNRREGLVFKTLDGQRTFKVISNSWLIAFGQ